LSDDQAIAPQPSAISEYTSSQMRECAQCGLISLLPRMRPELVADCPRCHHTLWRMRRRPFEFVIACGLAATLFYIFALVAPFLEISAYGRFQLARIETGPVQLSLQGFQLVGILVLAVTVILPGVKLGLMLLTLIGLRTRLLSPMLLKTLFRWYEPIGPWAMVDVYLLGFLVAYTRLIAIASVQLDTAVYSLIGLMISMAAADAALDSEAVWRSLDQAQIDHDTALGIAPPAPLPESATRRPIGCHCCGLINLGEPGERCARCRTTLKARKTDSIARSCAFLVAAIALYIPANIYPVMDVTQLAQTQPFTIMGGIFELINYGLWPLALLVFAASITIPLMKLLILAYMLVKTQLGSDDHLLGRTQAFRVINFIGRWSMIDVFMISILVALVRFQQFANIQADVGAPCFAAVVVLTMFAVEAFDPRLMWDVIGKQGQGALSPGPPPRAEPLEPRPVGEEKGQPMALKPHGGWMPLLFTDRIRVLRAQPLVGGPGGQRPPGLASSGTPL
jgi:paraquat-inducible protein A